MRRLLGAGCVLKSSFHIIWWMMEMGDPAGDTLLVKAPSSSTLLGAAERCDLHALVNALDRGVCADVCDPDTVRISGEGQDGRLTEPVEKSAEQARQGGERVMCCGCIDSSAARQTPSAVCLLPVWLHAPYFVF